MTDYFRESSIRNQFEGPVITMLDLWKSLSEEITGVTIEVMVADRRECPIPWIREAQAEANTALPQVLQGKVALVLWLDNLDHVTDVLLTHELGHWVLLLQGFKHIEDGKDKTNPLATLLNSLATHRPLYALQRSMGLEPQDEIDSRFKDSIIKLSESEESIDKQVQIVRALLIADDLMSCSNSLRDELEDIISEIHPKTYSLVKTIIETAPHYDLLDKEQNGRFVNMLVKKLKLGDGWHFADDVSKLKSKVTECSK